jgi:hypothetical protein
VPPYCPAKRFDFICRHVARQPLNDDTIMG